jgi:hypothetical protein
MIEICLTVTRLLSLEEEEMLTLPEHLGSSPSNTMGVLLEEGTAYPSRGQFLPLIRHPSCCSGMNAGARDG